MTAAVTTRPGAAPSASPRGPECAGPDHLRTRLAQQICRSQLTGPALLALGRPVATAGGACAHQTIDAQGQRAMPAALAALGPAVSHHLAVTPAGLADRLNGLPAQGWDGLLALDLLGHLPDGPALLAALAALHRLLRDGGRVALDLAALEHAELVQGRPLGADTGAAPGGEAFLRVADVLHAAVGLGLQPASLARVTIPVQISYGARDEVLTPRFNAEALCRALPRASCVRNADAGHYALFQTGTGRLGAPWGDPADDPAGFDRRVWQDQAWPGMRDFLASALR
ncbi:MAG: hypothetical protein CFE32_13785 [Alphaproteobacteria bacterium PA3]|nr:MAG: hypothetical protein CFE32_13785 [Alphaproteobacteria bacterium PA3]